MKVVIISILLFVSLPYVKAQPIVKIKNAHKYVGQEITVTGKLLKWGGSSYSPFGFIQLGPDSAHVQLEVISQGEWYHKAKTWVGHYKGKMISIKGQVYKTDDKLYMNATDNVKLVQ